jgi:hypothetical protein
LPGKQSVHAIDPGDIAYLPGMQSAQASKEELPTGLVVPAGQSSHASSDEAVETLLYFPSKHDVQTVAPAGENCPTSQLVHTVLLMAAVVSENFPASQAVHSLLPVVLNLPAGHSEQEAENDVAGPLRPDQPSVSRAFPATGEPM